MPQLLPLLGVLQNYPWFIISVRTARRRGARPTSPVHVDGIEMVPRNYVAHQPYSGSYNPLKSQAFDYTKRDCCHCQCSLNLLRFSFVDGHGCGRRCGREGDAGLNGTERERTRFHPHGECRINSSSEAIPNRTTRLTTDHPEHAGRTRRRPSRPRPRRASTSLGACRRLIAVPALAEQRETSRMASYAALGCHGVRIARPIPCDPKAAARAHIDAPFVAWTSPAAVDRGGDDSSEAAEGR
jgi:hypothetical protein